MSMIATDFKSFLTIKLKSRDDNLFDQYSRIFMVKILLVTSMVCGLSWYSDKFNCIIPGTIKILLFKEPAKSTYLNYRNFTN